MNGIYAIGAEGIADGSLNWTTATLNVRLVRKGTYVPNFATDQYVADVLANGATFVDGGIDELSNTTVTLGAFDADDVAMGSIPAGDAIDALLISEDSGDEATDRLLLFFDVMPGLPFTPDNTPVPIAWNNGINKIFRLAAKP